MIKAKLLLPQAMILEKSVDKSGYYKAEKDMNEKIKKICS